MLKLGRVTKVKVPFLVLVFVFNFDLFKFSAAILEKGLFSTAQCATSFPGSLFSASLGRWNLVAAGHVPSCDTNFSTGVGSTNNFVDLN